MICPCGNSTFMMCDECAEPICSDCCNATLDGTLYCDGCMEDLIDQK